MLELIEMGIIITFPKSRFLQALVIRPFYDDQAFVRALNLSNSCNLSYEIFYVLRSLVFHGHTSQSVLKLMIYLLLEDKSNII